MFRILFYNRKIYILIYLYNNIPKEYIRSIMKMINTIQKTENKIICSYCKSEHIKKDGKRKTKNRDLIQRYKCLE